MVLKSSWVLGEEEEEPCVQVKRDIFLIMTDAQYRYSLYQISDPLVLEDNSGDMANVRNFGEPLLKMDKLMFPEFMSFASIGSCIYMVGGGLMNKENKYCSSDKVFVYDTASPKNGYVLGPSMNAGKHQPLLFTLGTNLFALSSELYPEEDDDDSDDDDLLDFLPRFEMLRTDHLESGWSALPVPVYSEKEDSFNIISSAAVYVDGGSCRHGVIFVTVGEDGTYAFDVDKRVWNHVSDEALPFRGQAVSNPNDSSLCLAYSLKSERFSAFHFRYGDDGFQVSEILIEDSYNFPPLWPSLVCSRPMISVFAPKNRGYFIMTGVDKPPSFASRGENRYVKIYALEFSDAKHQVEASSRKKKKSKKRHGIEETKRFKLTNLWEVCFCGGPVCNQLIHVAAAFAM